MLRGERVHLRTVRERDLDDLYTNLNTLEYRGSYFPLGLQGEPTFRKAFDDNGFWAEGEGMLLMTDPDDNVVGEIEFFPITNYLTGYELSYLLFGTEHAGKGYTTEAVQLLTAYLFARLRIERLQLNIHPDNAASRRVAEKAGYTLEGLMRSCWFHRGEFHDLEIWSMIRSELPAQ
jgi:[ribosomal protein S5]-alanine N-acetyltransferase